MRSPARQKLCLLSRQRRASAEKRESGERSEACGWMGDGCEKKKKALRFSISLESEKEQG